MISLILVVCSIVLGYLVFSARYAGASTGIVPLSKKWATVGLAYNIRLIEPVYAALCVFCFFLWLYSLFRLTS